MKDPVFRVFLVALALILGAAFWYQRGERAEPRQAQGAAAETQPAPAASAAAAPAVRYPVPHNPPAADPPPAAGGPASSVPDGGLARLDASDALLQSALSRLFAGQRLEERLHLDAIVRRFVVTLDNLPGAKLPQRQSVTRSVPGHFTVDGDYQERVYLSAGNFPRYTPFVQLFEMVDSKRLIEVYVDLYPLFQQAYEELGYPTGYFNDRLIEVIDHLLEAPVVEPPVRLVRPRVLYQFADPELEALSAGHKLLVRMGPDNAARSKAKLRELRSMLVELAGAASGGRLEPGG